MSCNGCTLCPDCQIARVRKLVVTLDDALQHVAKPESKLQQFYWFLGALAEAVRPEEGDA